jgi:hypothetical protein
MVHACWSFPTDARADYMVDRAPNNAHTPTMKQSYVKYPAVP